MKNNTEKVVVRFAPSPTGLFHVGSARVALFNYLFAKQTDGKFILRIEDTDKIRSTKESEDDIMSGLKWLGFKYDEFYRQSEREDVYKKYLEKLIEEGKAYISKEEIKEEGQRAEVIRFKNPNKKVKFSDLVRGEIEFDTTELGDFVIAKSLEEPVFHLVVVVDDFEMGVTHVIRGEDHISNTPRHILIQEAIGAPIPTYAHLPLMLAEDRAKLSKRKHGEMTSVKFYQKMGYIPEAFINFLAFVGWNPGTEKEIYSVDELIKDFDMTKVQKAGAIFNMEKLLWYNKEYIKLLPHEIVEKEIISRLPEKFRVLSNIKSVCKILIDRITVWSDIEKMLNDGEVQYLFETPEYDKDLLVWKKDGSITQAKDYLALVLGYIEASESTEFTAESAKALLWPIAEQKGRGNILWPLRVSLSGKEKSPDPFVLLSALGKKESLERIDKAIKKLS